MGNGWAPIGWPKRRDKRRHTIVALVWLVDVREYATSLPKARKLGGVVKSSGSLVRAEGLEGGREGTSSRIRTELLGGEGVGGSFSWVTVASLTVLMARGMLAGAALFVMDRSAPRPATDLVARRAGVRPPEVIVHRSKLRTNATSVSAAMLVTVAAVRPVRSTMGGLGLVTGQEKVVPVAHATEPQHVGEAPRYCEERLHPVVVVALVRTPTPSRQVVAVSSSSACATVLYVCRSVDESVVLSETRGRWWW
jgi:hypothetical protein